MKFISYIPYNHFLSCHVIPIIHSVNLILEVPQRAHRIVVTVIANIGPHDKTCSNLLDIVFGLLFDMFVI